MITNPNAPMYPSEGHEGIDIRTYLTGMAMQGILAALDLDSGALQEPLYGPDYKKIAKGAVFMADVLLEEMGYSEDE